MADAISGAKGCSRSTLCCRLGRKAVRLSYPAMYTCKIEALARGLEYHTSASHRLRLKPPRNGQQADRMDAANTLRMSFGFRKRLMLCESKGQAQKQCFQDCCEGKLREEQAKAKKTASRQDPWKMQEISIRFQALRLCNMKKHKRDKKQKITISAILCSRLFPFLRFEYDSYLSSVFVYNLGASLGRLSGESKSFIFGLKSLNNWKRVGVFRFCKYIQKTLRQLRNVW